MSDLSAVICRSGATFRRLDHWVRRGYLKPEGGDGSGRPRVWPEREVQVAVAMVRYIEAGLTVQAAADAARNDGVTGNYLVLLMPVETRTAVAA